MKKLQYIVSALLVAATITQANAETLPYQNPALSFEERAEDLVSRLTLEEKAILMCDVSEAIPRLGIKKFNWWSEALHGVANQNNVTVFPEPIGMAASFNDELLYKVFDATSDEMRAKYNDRKARGEDDLRFYSLSVWTPNVNIFRDPRWGRGQETYGEDPYLTSRMGIAVVKGLQGPEDTKYRKLYACAKHYAVHSGPEWSRHRANVSDVKYRDLLETYLPAFKALVQKANVREVMCAYQRLDDEPCCGNTRLLQQILRDDWGFQHMVVSDCGAISDFWTSHKTSSDAAHAAAKGVISGTDVECGSTYMKLPEAVKRGLITEDEINLHVKRLLIGRFELGEMDDPSLVQWSQLPMSIINSDTNKQLALDMSRQTMTLLQNNNNILPLKKGKKVAVIGPNANEKAMLWGNYNGTPFNTITILDGITNKVGKNNVTYLKGCDLVNDKVLNSLYSQCSIDGKPGIKGTFWNNRRREGDPADVTYTANPLSVTTYGGYTFSPNLGLKNFSAKYETVFRPTESGEVTVVVEACGIFEVLVNGEQKVRQRTWRTTETKTPINVEAGKEYKIEILYSEVENWAANVKFNIGTFEDIDFSDVIKQLKGYDTVIFAGGISPQVEGEEMPINLPGFKGGDRTDIELPAVQRKLLKSLKDAGKHIVYVNCSGSAIALQPETETCDAILQAWYGGESGGQAIADVIYGDYNPSGKLPVTFYKNSEQLPDYEDYTLKGRTYRYMNDALFPFGYGLSYTTFKVGEATLSATTVKAGDPITLTVPVRNTGKRDGAEVVQVYVRKVGDTDGPLKTLKNFKRVELKAGKSSNVAMTLDAESFEFFNDDINDLATVAGEYEILYGTSSSDNDLRTIKVNLQ